MKHLFAWLATLLPGLLMSTNSFAQSTLNQSTMLTVEASSVVLFAGDDADKGAENPTGNIAAIAGYRISDVFSAGIGFGFDLESKSDSRSVSANGIYNEGLSSTLSTPLFIQIRADLTPDKSLCPYIAANLGYRATLARATDEQKSIFYDNKPNVSEIQYSRYYNSGLFAELTAGVSMPLGEHRLQIGLSYVNYNRKNTTLTAKNGQQVYNTTDSAKNGISFKFGLSF